MKWSIFFSTVVFSAVHVFGGSTVLVSKSSTGAQGNGASFGAISADGRYVAFHSTSALVNDDNNNKADVFLHDTLTKKTTRVSVSSSGAQANNDSWSPSLSANGRYIAYLSYANNLVANDNNGVTDIFVYDRQTTNTTLISRTADGLPANQDCQDPSISADGRFVAFVTASALVSYDQNERADVYVFNREMGTLVRASLWSDGTEGSEASYSPFISANGKYVVFESAAQLDAHDENVDQDDVYLHNLETGETIMCDLSTAGVQANLDSGSGYTSVSADGRYVAFYSTATNLVANDTNNQGDVFVHDVVYGTTTRISVTATGEQANGLSHSPWINGNGRFVVYSSFANNLVSGDTNGKEDVFVWSRDTGKTIRSSINSSGAQASGDSGYPSISADGRYAAFYSKAADLVNADLNGTVIDMFVHDNR